MIRFRPRSAAQLGSALALAFALSLCGCADGPRPLTDEELAKVTVDGRVSKWLPSRFSGMVHNESTLHLLQLELEIHGKRVHKDLRIAPGASRRVSLQYLFPEDDGFDTVDPATVAWRLVAATGSVAPP